MSIIYCRESKDFGKGSVIRALKPNPCAIYFVPKLGLILQYNMARRIIMFYISRKPNNTLIRLSCWQGITVIPKTIL